MTLIMTIMTAIIGIGNLVSKEPINRFSYFVMWFLLLVSLISRLVIE
jgi:hypothetical protein